MAMNILSVLFGIPALLIALIGFLPLLGALNWLVIPLAVVGLVFGIFAKETAGRNFNIVVLVFSILRLMLGGGLF